MSLSLCMIVKNEEANLPRCLESVKDIIDEMIIVDTGSTDSTVEIANKYGAKVYYFPWNGSFSAARNESLKYATCDWIMIMDADDEMEKSDQKALMELIKDSNADAYFLETISYVGDAPGPDVMMNLNLRVIRNGRGYFFSNNVHEQLYCNIIAVNPSAKILTEKIRFYHYGYLNKNISVHNKRARNINLLEKELELNPGFPFTFFNLGSEYFAMFDNAKALEYFEKAYQNFEPTQGFSSKLVLKMISCYMHLGRYDEALRLIDEGLGYYPAFTDLVYLKGLTYKWQGRYMPAIKYFTKCIKMGEASTLYNIIIGAGTSKSYFELGEIYYALEDFDSSIENLKNTLKYDPQFNLALVKLIKAYCGLKIGPKALKDSIEDLRTYQPDKFDSLVYNILMQEKYYDLALTYIEKSDRIHGPSSESKYNKTLCKLFLKKYGNALTVSESLKKDKEYCARASCCQAFCKTIQRKYPEAAKILTASYLNPDDVFVKVYLAFNSIMETGSTQVLCTDEKESPAYTEVIFDILKMLIVTHEFDTFEKALNLLNLVNDKAVLLRLAKLYYNERSYGLAYQEFIRSIQLFNLIDLEGADMLHKLKYKGL